MGHWMFEKWWLVREGTVSNSSFLSMSNQRIENEIQEGGDLDG